MSATSVTATNLRLTGASLAVARSVFVILSLAAVILFSLGVHLYYERFLQTLEPETLTALKELGISAAFYTAQKQQIKSCPGKLMAFCCNNLVNVTEQVMPTACPFQQYSGREP